MNKRALLIDNFYQMHQGLGFLHSIYLYRDEEDIYSCDLDIVLCSRQSPEKKMLIHFSGVLDFKSTDLNSLNTLLISIVDVSANQMEGIHYKIKEDEHELFSFYCDKFEFKIF